MYGVVGGEDEQKLRRPGSEEEPRTTAREGAGWGARGGGLPVVVDFARYALIEGMRERESAVEPSVRDGRLDRRPQRDPGDTEEADQQAAADVDTTVEAA